MKIHRLVTRSLISCALLLASQAVWATTCSYSSDNPSGNNPLEITMPLKGGTLSVGRDLPEGAVLFRQSFRTASGAIRISCPSSVTTIQRVRQLTSTPKPIIPGRPEFQGRVYETGVAGIGVAVWYAGNGFPYTDTIVNCGTDATCNWHSYNEFDISLIKTGPIGGGTIQGDQLPTTSTSWVTGNSVELLRVKFSRTINVLNQTCNTPDVNVPLGSHMIHDLKGSGSGTPWQDFKIELKNCPAVSGYFNGGAGNYPIWYSDSSFSSGNRSGHAVSYQLIPNAGSHDAPNGIAKLSASSPGEAPAASGVGVQIANRSNQPIHLARTALYAGPNLPVGSPAGSNFEIPLRARYLQVADKVTPGPANSAVVFLLNYR
ncbi:fimbrial protein [Pseudomonas donghuensis]|uniref:fimbrial protein n=1 Tax=Pseudomonas donghuensis TaxID=1163398 RepID=UPI002E14511E|nr:fimbrial protein [Pseudomonas donghuensis]